MFVLDGVLIGAGDQDYLALAGLAPAVMLAAAIALVALCVTRHWKLRESPGPEPSGIAGAPLDPGLLAAD